MPYCPVILPIAPGHFLTDVAAEVNTRLSDRYNPPNDVCNHYRNWLTEQLDDHLPKFGPSSWGFKTASTLFGDLGQELPLGNFFNQARDWLTGIVQNGRGGWLGPCNSHDPAENVLVIGGIEIFETGLPLWIDSLGENVMPHYRTVLPGLCDPSTRVTTLRAAG